MTRKSDADRIAAHMKSLRAKLDKSRLWWPDYVFRSDHVENTATILNTGRLLSRAAAEEAGLIKIDAGSPDYVDKLSNAHRRYVRLYFRPQTPTQYHNEGIRPKHQIRYNAHMPVPMYLLFSSALLGDQGVRFTRGRLELDTAIGHTSAFLRDSKFEEIYHVGPVGVWGEPNRQSHIINARNAEVLVRDELGLGHVKRIVCRSSPERDTLLTLLDSSARKKWIGRIVLEGQRQLFLKRGTFLQEVELSADHSNFTFYSNIDRDWRKPFELVVRWRASDGWRGIYRKEDFEVPTKPLRIRLQQRTRYKVSVRLNGDLAYRGMFDEARGPELLS